MRRLEVLCKQPEGRCVLGMLITRGFRTCSGEKRLIYSHFIEQRLTMLTLMLRVLKMCTACEALSVYGNVYVNRLSRIIWRLIHTPLHTQPLYKLLLFLYENIIPQIAHI